MHVLKWLSSFQLPLGCSYSMCKHLRCPEPSRAVPSRPEPSRTFWWPVCGGKVPSRPEPSRARPSRPKPSQTRPSRPQPSPTRPSRPQPSPARPSHTEPLRCHILCLSSFAESMDVAKFLSGAIRTCPWVPVVSACTHVPLLPLCHDCSPCDPYHTALLTR